MKIRYIGHSCFLLTDSAGTVIVTDPYGDIGLDFPVLRADAVTVSHSHYDHCNIGAVGGSPAVFGRAGKYLFRGIGIEAKESLHDDVGGRKRGSNLIFTFVMDGIKICHLGDLGEKLSEDLLNRIGRPDVLLLPVGGNYTIDGAEAAELVKRLSPAVAIPMHFKVKGLKVDVSDEKRFLACVQAKAERMSEVALTCGELGKEIKIILMERS